MADIDPQTLILCFADATMSKRERRREYNRRYWQRRVKGNPDRYERWKEACKRSMREMRARKAASIEQRIQHVVLYQSGYTMKK